MFYSVSALPPNPPADFKVTLVDESNRNLELPAYLEITEILDDQILQKYRIDLFSNPQSTPTYWFVPSTEKNTEIHITAIRQGFENSDEFVFTITEQTPTVGQLFEHTFVLTQEKSSMINEKQHQVSVFGDKQSFTTKSSSDIQSVNFIEGDENVLVIILNEDALSGFIDFIIPTDLLKPPFTVLLDDITIFPLEDEKAKTTNVHLEYSNGLHSVRIIAYSEITEIVEREQIQEEFEQETTEEDGGCLIATATSELAPQVQMLREIRDNSLLQTELGTNFMNSFNEFYYSFSPIIADYERENPVFKEMIKIAITPMISSLSILNYVDMDSELEVLGYGISLIILNIGMYFGIPAIVIMRIRK